MSYSEAFLPRNTYASSAFDRYLPDVNARLRELGGTKLVRAK